MTDDVRGVVIAEIGSVHDGSFGNAMKAVELAADCCADIVKFQTHIAAAETRRDAPLPPYFKGEPRYEYFERTAFSPEQWRRLKAHSESVGVGLLSSPFAIEAVDLLEAVGIDAYKVASGEVSNLPLLERIAETARPVYLSSGMSGWAELDRAVASLAPGGPITVMQCSSVYPCPAERVGINVITEMRARYGGAVGFSDHTLGVAAGVAAAMAGATAIEKHLTFSKRMYGSDAAHSMEPDEFAAYVAAVREAWTMASHPVDKDDVEPYREMKRIFEKSVVAARPLPAGAILARADLAFKKPGNAFPAARYRDLVGRRLAVAIGADDPITLDMLGAE